MFKRKFRSRAPKRGRRRRIVLFMLFLMLLLTLQSYIYIERNVMPPLMNLAKVRLKQIATQSINAAISERIATGTNFEKLIEWQKDNNGKTSGFMLNYAEHMKITADTINTVQGLFDKLSTIPEHIPLGLALHSPILASFGPEIPVRLVPAGNVKVDLNTQYQNAGINMILVEVYIRIIAEVSVIIPFDSEPEIVETKLPISYLLVVGDTPMYYFDNKGNPLGNSAPLPPNVSLPDLKMSQGSAGAAQSGAVQGQAGDGTGTGTGTGAAAKE